MHKDNNYPHPQFPYYFIANIPLCDFSIENGATEFWLGSHAATSAADQVRATTGEHLKTYPMSRLNDPIPSVSEDALRSRRAVRPPMQPACRKGDIMIRDIRLWHAGMPNDSDSHRIMLGLGYMVRRG